MPKVTEAHLAGRREQILEAAIACFARDGFHQTKMADIAREAGISPGAIYRYFASKEDVIEASAQARRGVRAARFQAVQQHSGALQDLDELIDLYFESVGQPDAFRRLSVQLYGEALRNHRVRESVRSIWDDIQPRIEEIVRRAQAQGDVDPALDPSGVALLLMAAFEGIIVHKTIDPDVDVRKIASIMKALYSGKDWRDVGPASDEKD